VHRVSVPAFLMCTTECPQGVWERHGGKNQSNWKGPNLPLEKVSWAEAEEWCGKLGLRLPTEAEWEYACRAGSTSKWCWGDNVVRLADDAWYFLNSGNKILPLDTEYDENKARSAAWGCRSHPVGELRPNAWGLYDMQGNVREWCQDDWHNTYAGAPADGSAWPLGGSSLRVFRGGSLYSAANDCRCAVRFSQTPDFRYGDLGFRPAASLPR
jgi:formylglycine-generating enzyme required for sulfatase activity